MSFQWVFWVTYLLPTCIGLSAGWWLRGLYEADKREAREYRREAMRRELERAKSRHPAYRKVEG